MARSNALSIGGHDLAARVNELTHQVAQLQGLGSEALTPPGYQIDPVTSEILYASGGGAAPSRATLSTIQNVAASGSPAAVTVALDTLSFGDTGVTLSGNGLKVPAGTYYVIANVNINPGSNTNSWDVAIQQNGVTYSRGGYSQLSASNAATIVNLDMIKCNANDVLTMQVISLNANPSFGWSITALATKLLITKLA